MPSWADGVSFLSMKLGGRERVDDGDALEALFAHLPVSANFTMGFLAALGSGPDPIPTPEWVPVILPDSANARARVDLLERLFVAAGETLRTTPEIIPPEADKPADEVTDFCTGYVRGAALHRSWVVDETATKMLGPFAELARPGADPAALRAQLGRAVAEIFAYWQSKRQVVNASPKVGRNDPCPCGSGKKQKKCGHAV